MPRVQVGAARGAEPTAVFAADEARRHRQKQLLADEFVHVNRLALVDGDVQVGRLQLPLLALARVRIIARYPPGSTPLLSGWLTQGPKVVELERMVAEGRLGRKSGRGFYEWNE